MQKRGNKDRLRRTAVMFVVILMMGITSLWAQYNKEYFLWMGREMMIKGEFSEAISLLNTIIHRDEKEYEGYMFRGIAKYNMGDLIGADADFTLAIEHNPVYTQAYTYRAITRSRLGNYDDALEDFAEAIELRPDIPNAYYSRGVTRLLNQQFEEAIEDFDKFIIQDHKVAEAYINRGICYLHLKDTLHAFREFDRAISTNHNSPDGYSCRGSLLMSQERYKAAIQDFNMAIKNDSTHLQSYFNRAIAHNNLHRPESALNDLDEVIKLDSTSSITYFNRAIMLSQIGDYNRALEDYDRVAELSPANVLVYFYRANLLTRLGEIERAERDYTQAIELYPDFANAYLSRSNIRFLLRNPQGALRDKKLAEQKIADHRSKLRDSNYSIYTDSTYKFDKLLSFDTKLSGSSFERQSGKLANSDLKLIPLFKFTLQRRDTTTIEHHEYYDAKLEQFIADVGNPFIAIDHATSNISRDSLLNFEKQYTHKDGQTNWRENFQLGVIQGNIKQYTSSIASLTEAINDHPENPFLYINRSATRAEMIEFISSIESSFQRITIDADPAKRLNAMGNDQRKYDYDDAIADIQEAIKLHPTLAYNHYNLGGLMVITGDLPRAYDAYSKAIILYPNFGEAYYNRGIVQIMMKDTRKGCIDLSKGGELGVMRAYDLLKRYSKLED